MPCASHRSHPQECIHVLYGSWICSFGLRHANGDFAYAVPPGPRSLGLEACLRGLEVRGRGAARHAGGNGPGADPAGGATTAAGTTGALGIVADFGGSAVPIAVVVVVVVIVARVVVVYFVKNLVML